jgi:hypothetical protein
MLESTTHKLPQSVTLRRKTLQKKLFKEFKELLQEFKKEGE